MVATGTLTIAREAVLLRGPDKVGEVGRIPREGVRVTGTWATELVTTVANKAILQGGARRSMASISPILQQKIDLLSNALTALSQYYQGPPPITTTSPSPPWHDQRAPRGYMQPQQSYTSDSRQYHSTSPPYHAFPQSNDSAAQQTAKRAAPKHASQSAPPANSQAQHSSPGNFLG